MRNQRIFKTKKMKNIKRISLDQIDKPLVIFDYPSGLYYVKEERHLDEQVCVQGILLPLHIDSAKYVSKAILQLWPRVQGVEIEKYHIEGINSMLNTINMDYLTVDPQKAVKSNVKCIYLKVNNTSNLLLPLGDNYKVSDAYLIW